MDRGVIMVISRGPGSSQDGVTIILVPGKEGVASKRKDVDSPTSPRNLVPVGRRLWSFNGGCANGVSMKRALDLLNGETFIRKWKRERKITRRTKWKDAGETPEKWHSRTRRTHRGNTLNTCRRRQVDDGQRVVTVAQCKGK